MNLIIKISDWIFYVIGGLFLLTTILCYYMQIEDGEGLRQMIIGSGIMFLIPQAAGIIAGLLEFLGEVLSNKISTAK